MQITARNWLIKLLGGYTSDEFDEVEKDGYETFNEMVRRGDTIRELQALVPSSPFLQKKRGEPDMTLVGSLSSMLTPPKKRGRPKKVVKETV